MKKIHPFNTLYFETTRRCNLSCPFCSSGSQIPVADKAADLATDVILKRILKPAFALGTRFIDFSGGEFLLRKDALMLLHMANELGFGIGIATNGILLDDALIKEIIKTVDRNVIISFGINSFDDQNQETRDTSDDFILRKIELLEKYKVNTNISITIGEFNKESFEKTVKKIRELKLPFNRIPFSPRNCQRNDLMPDKASIRNFFHPVLRNYFNGQVSYTPYFLPQKIYEMASGQDLNAEQIPLNPPVGCWVGAYYAINPEGDVSPCPMFLDQVQGGNVLDTDLNEILFESTLFKTITNRKGLKGKCGHCEYTYTCGGCRVMAYFHTNDLYGEDPLCFIKDLTPEELKKYEDETVKSFRNYLRMAYFGRIYKPPSE